MDMFTLVRHLRLPPMRRGTRWALLAVAALWLGSLVLVWWWTQHSAADALSRLHAVTAQLHAQAAQIGDLQQRATTLKRSDDISRAANQELQTSLSERDEEVSALRADVAYDLLVMLKETSDQIAGLRRPVMEYHPSVIGHGVLISELEARVRRVEPHLDLPAIDFR